MRPPDELAPHEDDDTPVLVSGLLAGIAGGSVGITVTGAFALFSGDPLAPMKLVAAALMGPASLQSENALPATLLGGLLTVLLAALLGVLFTWLRRRERRMHLLVAEGIGFGLVVYGASYIVMPYLNGTMYAHQPQLPLALAHALFGAALSLELPLRVGPPDEVATRAFSLSRPPQ